MPVTGVQTCALPISWKRKLDRAELMAGPHEDVEKELARLRRENELLRAERDLLKKATAFFASKAEPSSTAGDKSMSFALIDAKKADVPVEIACAVLNVSVSGFYAWKTRPASKRQTDDMILLAHIRAEFATSNETYGSRHAEGVLRHGGCTPS